MHLPTISVVTPSYNQSQFIERTIRSVLDQDYLAIEYFVLDGGSTDTTLEVLRNYGPQLTGWQSCKDNGQSDAVNQGWRRSTGEVIGWLNSDDVYCPGALASVARYFADHPQVDVLYGGGQVIDENDCWMSTDPAIDYSLDRLLEEHFIPQPSMFFRRKVLDAGFFLDESLHCHMDRDFQLRLALAGFRFARTEPVLSQTRWHTARKCETLIRSTTELSCCDREFMEIFERLFVDGELKRQHGVSIARGLLNRCEARYALFDPVAVRHLARAVLHCPVVELHPRARTLLRNSYLPVNVIALLRAAKRTLHTRASA